MSRAAQATNGKRTPKIVRHARFQNIPLLRGSTMASDDLLEMCAMQASINLAVNHAQTLAQTNVGKKCSLNHLETQAIELIRRIQDTMPIVGAMKLSEKEPLLDGFARKSELLCNPIMRERNSKPELMHLTVEREMIQINSLKPQIGISYDFSSDFKLVLTDPFAGSFVASVARFAMGNLILDIKGMQQMTAAGKIGRAGVVLSFSADWKKAAKHEELITSGFEWKHYAGIIEDIGGTMSFSLARNVATIDIRYPKPVMRSSFAQT